MARRSNGMGCLVFKGEGRPWLARWRWKGQLYTKSTGEVSRERAEKVLERLTRPYREDSALETLRVMESRVRAQEARAFSAKSLAVSELLGRMESSVGWADLAENTRRSYRRMLNSLVSWLEGEGHSGLVRDVTPAVARRFMEHMAGRTCPTTYNTYQVFLSRTWGTYGREGGCASNPWEGIQKRPVPRGASREPFTAEEVARMMEAARGDSDMEVLLALAAYLGLRISDCATMKWSQIDRVGRVARVVPMKTRRYMAGPLELPIHPVLAGVLERKWRESGGKSEYVSERNAGFYRRRTLARAVRTFMDRCGVGEFVEDERGRRRNTRSFHCLRHFFCSTAVNSGMNPFDVARIVGHQSYTMTRNYWHSNADVLRRGLLSFPDLSGKGGGVGEARLVGE